MLQHCWLLSDFDGTIVATPHKAHGQYLTLNESPCMSPLQRWLANGGNLCIITTANKRVVNQLYVPLREMLVDKHSANLSDDTTTAPNGNGKDPCGAAGGDCSAQGSGAGIVAKRNCGGQLLLSLNTGAVLYRCSREGISFVPGYTKASHRASEDSVRLARLYGVRLDQESTTHVDSNGKERVVGVERVRGTCFTGGCGGLLSKLEETYLRLTEDLIRGEKQEVVSSFLCLSLRYQKVWRLVLDYIDGRYVSRRRSQAGPIGVSQSGNKRGEIGKVLTAEEAEWKCNFIWGHKQMFAMLGFIHVEVADAEIVSLVGTQAVVDKAKAARNERRGLGAYTRWVFDDDSDAACMTVKKVMKLLGATIPKNFSHGGNVVSSLAKRIYNGLFTRQSGENVTQVLALGIPMKMFPLYFEPMVRDLAAAGVTAIPQPNSVAFGKLGICKSTTVRYLTDKPGRRQRDRIGLGGVVDLTQAIALGDNPHTADYELTVHPGLRFISLETAKQRKERHTYIDACRSSDSSSEPARLSNALRPTDNGHEPQPRGMLMDDRRVKNIYYVGGEEDGTAVFLDRLMNILGVPVSNHPAFAFAPVEPQAFAEAVPVAAAQAAVIMNAGVSRL